MIQLPGLVDGKSPLRDASLETFINNSEIERHGNRRGLIGAGVVELAVHHNDNGNQPRLARARKLNEAESARSQIRRLATIGLCQLLRIKRSATKDHPGRAQRERQDDGGEPLAV